MSRQAERLLYIIIVYHIDNNIVTTPTLMYTGGVTPYDGRPKPVVDHTHLAVTVIYCLLGILGLAFATICLAFNIVFKNKR